MSTVFRDANVTLPGNDSYRLSRLARLTDNYRVDDLKFDAESIDQLRDLYVSLVRDDSKPVAACIVRRLNGEDRPTIEADGDFWTGLRVEHEARRGEFLDVAEDFLQETFAESSVD